MLVFWLVFPLQGDIGDGYEAVLGGLGGMLNVTDFHFKIHFFYTRRLSNSSKTPMRLTWNLPVQHLHTARHPCCSDTDSSFVPLGNNKTKNHFEFVTFSSRLYMARKEGRSIKLSANNQQSINQSTEKSAPVYCVHSLFPLWSPVTCHLWSDWWLHHFTRWQFALSWLWIDAPWRCHHTQGQSDWDQARTPVAFSKKH